jgi:hypothetical protein
MRKKKVPSHPKLVLDKTIIANLSSKKQPNGARCDSYASGPCNPCSVVATVTDVGIG